MNPVVHFEMPYEDRDRAAKFYSEVFGWRPQMLGEEMGKYVVMQTGETDEKGMIKNPGQINGGMYKKTEDSSSFAPSVVIAVKDINEAKKKIEAAGGRIARGPEEIPGIGMWISFYDSEGNRVSALQPNPIA